MNSSNLRWRASLIIETALRESVKRSLDEIEPIEIFRSCLSCDHFVESQEACKISDMQRPPARIIAFGCTKYDNLDDDIPF